ncbi:hypothetical protein SFC82_15130 [Legionella pneumophila]|nr:hypothetical protein [Legionella pneumophila]
MDDNYKVSSMINGVDIATLKKTIGTIQKDPKLGQCEFRLKNEWINGDSNRSYVDTLSLLNIN